MKTIPIHGGSVVIDDADFWEVMQYQWFVNTHGYANRWDGKAVILMHRELMGFPDGEVDHSNGNKLDNRRGNLRLATRTENMRNRQPVARRKDAGPGTKWSAYKGVSYYPKYAATRPWCARIRFDGKQHKLGRFASEEEAAKAYDAAAAEHFGEFAYLNFR